MANHTAKRWRTATGSPVFYWLLGVVLIWLMLPAGTMDIVLAHDWFAPHWRCDSLGVPLIRARQIALPYAAIALVLSGILTLISTRKRLGGRGVFDLRMRATAWDWCVTIGAAILIAPLVFDIGQYFVDVTFEQTVTANCARRAEEITVTMRRPLVQVLPVVEALLILWLLHLRAYALTPRRG
jgi:hypothetical protein